MQQELSSAAQIISKTSIPNIPEELIRLKEELNKNTQTRSLSRI
jgi:hypothetical protein